MLIPRDHIVVAPSEATLAAGAGSLAIVKALAPEPGGDAAFWGRAGGKDILIGVERKTGPNLVNSWWSGELADQLSRMGRAYGLVILLIAGWLHASPGRHIVCEDGAYFEHSFDALWNDLQTWQDAGLRVQQCGLGDEGRRLWSLYHYYQKEEHKATRQMRMRVGKETLLLRTPGLGPKRTESLLRRLCARGGAKKDIREVLGEGKVFKAFMRILKEGSNGCN